MSQTRKRAWEDVPLRSMLEFEEMKRVKLGEEHRWTPKLKKMRLSRAESRARKNSWAKKKKQKEHGKRKRCGHVLLDNFVKQIQKQLVWWFCY